MLRLGDLAVMLLNAFDIVFTITAMATCFTLHLVITHPHDHQFQLVVVTFAIAMTGTGYTCLVLKCFSTPWCLAPHDVDSSCKP